jgi:hypothetical protein
LYDFYDFLTKRHPRGLLLELSISDLEHLAGVHFSFGPLSIFCAQAKQRFDTDLACDVAFDHLSAPLEALLYYVLGHSGFGLVQINSLRHIHLVIHYLHKNARFPMSIEKNLRRAQNRATIIQQTHLHISVSSTSRKGAYADITNRSTYCQATSHLILLTGCLNMQVRIKRHSR